MYKRQIVYLGQEMDGKVVVSVPEDALLHQEDGAAGFLDLQVESVRGANEEKTKGEERTRCRLFMLLFLGQANNSKEKTSNKGRPPQFLSEHKPLWSEIEGACVHSY